MGDEEEGNLFTFPSLLPIPNPYKVHRENRSITGKKKELFILYLDNSFSVVGLVCNGGKKGRTSL